MKSAFFARPMLGVLAISLACVFVTACSARAGNSNDSPFSLKSGDRVVFYGDSITDQRMYTLLAEEYVVTRFPQRDIHFIHSGWGGDRVTGGGGGPIDVRLDRDVTAYKPTVVSIMLGMNDGSYQAFDEKIYQTYADGYRHLVEKLKKDNPGVRLTLIQPSPYDDITQPAKFDGGYNAVLVRYGAFLRDLASSTGATVADLNTPVVAMLKKAQETKPEIARRMIPDRIHPGWGGHLIMAEQLLKAWNAPSVVSQVTVDAAALKATADNAQVTNLNRAATGEITWMAKEEALPFPLTPPDRSSAEAYNLAIASSDFVDALDREMLMVANLTAASYALKIDEDAIGTFTKEQLAAGINLATLRTPMVRQADAVAFLTQLRSNTHNTRWRSIQVPYNGDKAMAPLVPGLLKDLDAADASLYHAQHDAAKPQPHTFRLTPQP